MRQPTEYIVWGALGLILCAAQYVFFGGYSNSYWVRDCGEPIWFRSWAAVGVVVFTLGFLACWFWW